jgi:hypothetical protein
MFWIIVAGILVIFFYILCFSLTKSSSRADEALKAIFLNLELEKDMKKLYLINLQRKLV